MNLEEFIKTQIESVDELRTLLLFHSNAHAEWNLNEAAGRLYISPTEMGVVLSRLKTKGFLAGEGEPVRYRFQPHAPELGQLVSELAELDRQRPVTLINMIYGRQRDIRAFADAFKIKKQS